MQEMIWLVCPFNLNYNKRRIVNALGFFTGGSMSDSSKDAGLIQVLAERLETQRLPRALSIKEKVDNGGLLDNFDIEFLKEVFEDANAIKPLLDRHPEWQPLAAKMVHMYKEITDKALKNEQSGQQ
jgi:hypothetical protein